MRLKKKREKMAKELAALCRTHGKVITTLEEYSSLPWVPQRARVYFNFFNSWAAAIDAAKKVDPTLEADLTPKPKPKPKPTKKARPAPAVKKVTIDE